MRIDKVIAKELEHLSAAHPHYWSYSQTCRRTSSYDYFQYPAMMVPLMLRDLLRTIAQADSDISTVFDPFIGSGTVLTEAMFQGLNFSGADVNPMAVLLSKMKAGPFEVEKLESRIEDLLDYIEEDKSTAVEANFPNIRKWFDPHVIVELSAIRRGIRNEPSLWCRRFFWVALAETVRQCSNSRTSTYKLHIRSKSDLQARRGKSALRMFDEVLTQNLMVLSEHRQMLESNNLLRANRYIHRARVTLRDSRNRPKQTELYDLLVTSPPYGDNATTVPYGQHSYLPLQWIDFADIDEEANETFLRNTHAIDTMSLGGSCAAERKAKERLNQFPTLVRTLDVLRPLPIDRSRRVLRFATDLLSSITAIMSLLRANAYMVWIVGNRRVGGMEIPTCCILKEFLASHGAVHVLTLDRVIPSKRMALKNNISKTMLKEQILIFRKR